jgi:hypothetical protein|tara:strand:+ start:427 stop:1086 length:660 start_codon:yes stop_codon:yes gene_type:complete
MKKLHALVLGATGSTGQELLKLLLKDSGYSKVSIFVRGKPTIEHQKLTTHEIDFSRLKDYKRFVEGDVLFSALGTTLKDAGSRSRQYLVDFTYQYEFAKMASDNGIPHFSLVSSAGANQKSFFFYPKIKGELEQAVKKLAFKKIQIFQPPILIRQPELIRSGEKIGIKVFTVLNKIGFLKSQKPLSVSFLAEKMISEIKSDRTLGMRTYKPNDIIYSTS